MILEGPFEDNGGSSFFFFFFFHCKISELMVRLHSIENGVYIWDLMGEKKKLFLVNLTSQWMDHFSNGLAENKSVKSFASSYSCACIFYLTDVDSINHNEPSI